MNGINANSDAVLEKLETAPDKFTEDAVDRVFNTIENRNTDFPAHSVLRQSARVISQLYENEINWRPIFASHVAGDRSYRKTLAVADFVGDFSGPRVDEAKRAVSVACKGKFPTEIAKADFMKGCGKDDASRTPTDGDGIYLRSTL